MFLYICDFDEIMKVEKEKVILLLENLFRIYDSLCDLYGIQKIEVLFRIFFYNIIFFLNGLGRRDIDL